MRKAAGLAFLPSIHFGLGQSGGNYATPGLYIYTVPAGGPLQIRVTTQSGKRAGQPVIHSLSCRRY